MRKIKLVVFVALLVSLFMGTAVLAAASDVPRTESGAVDWSAYTTYDRDTDTCCCSGYVAGTDDTDDSAGPGLCEDCGGERCPDCGDCTGCGTDPCPTCCGDGRRCGRCRLCIPVTLSDYSVRYNGSSIPYSGARFNSPVDSIRYYYVPVSGGAALSDGLPYRAGTYRVTAVFTSRAVRSGSLTATMFITPAPLQVLGISINDKVYDASSVASYARGVERGLALEGVFGSDIVELSTQGTPYFSSVHAGKTVPVNFVGFELGGIHAWNYYVTQPTYVSATISPAPLVVNIELSEKIYDMTRNAVIKSVSEPFGVFDVGGVLDDVKISMWGAGTYATPYPDDNIPVKFSGFKLSGKHAGNYFVDASDKIGVILQAPLTLKVVYDGTKVYDTTVDVNVDDIVLDGMMPGDDIALDAIGELFYTTPDVGEDIPLEFTEFTIKGSSFDYYNITYPSELVADITPALLTLDIVLEDKVYDGTTDATLKSATLVGILENDDVEIDVYGIPAFTSPNSGNRIAVAFTDFTLKGGQAENYYLVQPGGYTSIISRAPVSVWINDEDLKIGGVLDFDSSEDVSGWDIQWYADGEPIPGANSGTYTIQPADADKEISVRVVSTDGNKEGNAEPTAPVPFTIRLVINESIVPMGDDNACFGSPGNMVAYAASRNSGFVNISYVLYNSGYRSDRLEFSVGAPSVTSAGSGSSRYYASPADAVNGVITITATFYHRGISIQPEGAYAFPDVECSNSNYGQVHTIAVSQLGNAPTGPVDISVTGAHPSAFDVYPSVIPGIGVGLHEYMNITVDLDSAPNLADGISLYTATVNFSVDGIVFANIPVSVVIKHDFNELTYHNDGHYHDHSCKNCKRYVRGDCVYTPWRTEDGIHVRNCTICSGVDLHDPNWNTWSQGSSTQHNSVCTRCPIVYNEDHTWSSWEQGSASQHIRTCSVCSRVDNASHTWANYNTASHRCSACQREAAHAWGSWSAWSQGDSTNHTRTRTCGTAGCSRTETSTANHTWSSWSQGDSSNHTRSCTVCSRSNSASHNWGSWGTGNASQHTRSCNTCGRSNSVNHSWGSWGQGNAANHTRSCTVCGRSGSASHTWVWKPYNADRCALRCSVCNRWDTSRLPLHIRNPVTGNCSRCGSMFYPASIEIDWDLIGIDPGLSGPPVTPPGSSWNCGCGCGSGISYCFDCGDCQNLDFDSVCKTCGVCLGCLPKDKENDCPECGNPPVIEDDPFVPPPDTELPEGFDDPCESPVQPAPTEPPSAPGPQPFPVTPFSPGTPFTGIPGNIFDS